MHTKETIHAQMREMGVSPSGIVLVHMSMKAVGEVEGRGEGFLDALIDYFDEDGILLIPTHTWKNLGRKSPTMDMTDPEEVCIGLIPRLAVSHPKGHRSQNPTHSMVAFSKDDRKAQAFIEGESTVISGTNENGCYGKLYALGAKILLIGVGHNKDTYLHAVEEMIGVPNRISKDLRPTSVRLATGEIVAHPTHCHKAVGCEDVSAHFPKLEPLFDKAGAIRRGTIGDAACQLCDCRIMHDVCGKLHAEHPEELMFDDKPIPVEWY